MEKNLKFNIPAWNIEQLTGYKPQTTFWSDFSTADLFGTSAIKDTFKRAFEEWKDDTVFVTELAMVLNYRWWKHYKTGNMLFSGTYQDLYYQVMDWADENLKGEDADYFYKTLD